MQAGRVYLSDIFFLWGFAASPQDMVPEARKCFANAVCYIEATAQTRA